MYVNFTNNRKPSSRKSILFFKKKKKQLFIYFWLYCLHCSLGFSLAVVCGPFITVASCVMETGSRARGLRQLWHVGSAAASPKLCSSGSIVWRTGLAALPHVWSSWTRDWTRVPALAGEFLTTVQPGKPPKNTFQWRILSV